MISSDVNNYRGITLTSIFSKMYSHILDSPLRTWADDINILNESQLHKLEILTGIVLFVRVVI